ncbi:MAG TPA: hypothetical protein VIL09_01375 [Microvirga sp.]
MTDSKDPFPRRPRKDASREPPTLDLKATVVDTPAPADEAKPSADTSGVPDETPVSAGLSDTLPAADATAITGERADSLPPADTEPAVIEPSDTLRAEGDRPDALPPGNADGVGTESMAPPPPPASADRRSGASFGSLLGAGLLGGLIGAGALAAYDQWRSSQGGGAQLAQVQQQLSGFARQDNLRALEGRLAALESGQGTVNQRLQAAQTLAERAATRAEEAASRPAAAVPAAPGAPPQPSPDLTNRLAALETQLRDRNQAPTPAVTELTNRVAGLETQLRGQGQAATTAAQGQERRLGELDQRLAALDQRLGSLDQRVGSLDQRVGAVTRQVAEGGSEATRAGTRVVLVDRLANALREGAPYGEVLAGLRRFTPDAARLQPLEPFAGGGAPTAAALAQSFEPVGERILRESRPADESWTDRLLRMADRVVTVRAVNEPGGTGVPGLVTRIEQALARGAFADAAAAFDALPEPSRRVGEGWGRTLKQRAAAEAAARAVAAEAVASLNQSTR